MNHHTHSAFRRGCQNSLGAVLFCLNIVAHTAVLHAQEPLKFNIPEKTMAFDTAVSELVRKLGAVNKKDLYINGKINENLPEVKQYRADYAKLKSDFEIPDGRGPYFKKMAVNAGVAEHVVNAGSDPKTPLSDNDMAALKAGEAEKLAAYMRDKGIEILELPDRFMNRDSFTNIYKFRQFDTPGTALHRLQCQAFAAATDVFSTSGGLFKTSDGKMGILDTLGVLLANANKLSHALHEPQPLRLDLPESVSHIDHRTAEKSVSKASVYVEASEYVREGTISLADAENAERARKAKGFSPANSWEELGVVNFNDTPEVKAEKILRWRDKQIKYFGKAGDFCHEQSVNEAKYQGEMMKRLDRDGLPTFAEGEWQKRVHANVTNEETMYAIARRDPALAAEMSGISLVDNRDGTFTDDNGKKLTSSEVRQKVKEVTMKRSREILRAAGGTWQPMPVESPRPPESRISRITGVGGSILNLGFAGLFAGDLVNGTVQAVEEEVDAEQPGGDIWTLPKSIARGLYYTFGIPHIRDMAEKAGIETSKEMDIDQQRGVAYSEGTYQYIAAVKPAVKLFKGMTYDLIMNAPELLRERLEPVKDAISDAISDEWAEYQSLKFQQNSRDYVQARADEIETQARETEGAEARAKRLSEAENVFQRRGIPVVSGGKVENAAQENERLKQSNPDGYNYRLALILTEFDRLAMKLKRDEAINDERPRAKDEIYKLLQQKYTSTPQEFQKALTLQYSKYNKNYAIAPTPQELGGKWNGGRMTVRSAKFGANSGCTPEIQAKLDILRGQAMPLDLDVQTDANGNGSLSLGFAPGASALTGQEGPTRVPFQFKDGKIQGEVAQAGGRVFKVDGELVRTDSGWALNGSWQMSASIEGSTVMLIKGDLSASK